jgi:ATP-dependent Lon protease
VTLEDYEQFPSEIFVVVEDNTFLYPFMISPIFLSQEIDKLAIEKALNENSLILVTTSKDKSRDIDALYDIGVIGSIMRKVNLPDGRIKVLFQGLARGSVKQFIEGEPISAVVDKMELSSENELKVDALMNILLSKVKEIAALSNYFPPDLLKSIEDTKDAVRVADLIASSISLDKEEIYEMFSTGNIEVVLMDLITALSQEIEINKVQLDIKSKVQSNMEKINREYFLKEQLKQIEKELGFDGSKNEELEEYEANFEKIEPYLSEDAQKEITKQLKRYARLNPDSADASVLQGWLESVFEIPFGIHSANKLDIHTVQKQLEKDHYSLQKPKDRIVEYFAVKELNEQRGNERSKGENTIICFAGPPGVGKTSLANSIATALGRKLVRIALGGLDDVSELRGHRRTYIGAMAGRIVQGVIEAKEMDCVMVLDEIDKLSRNLRGDPTSVLLEILDPEQNAHFRDHFLNFSIDLSQTIFIATANDVSKIPAPLRDRMEFIFLSSYTPSEKYEIAKKYLIPQELKKHGLKKSELSITKGALSMIIENYTREAGVRSLRRVLAQITRKVARELLEGEVQKVSITVKNLSRYLERIIFEIEKVDKENLVGVVNGLAWTSVGGDVLKIEAIKLKGKGALTLTGSLGEVMKESARIAFSVVKVLIDEGKLSVDSALIPKTKQEEERVLDASEVYRRFDLHLHIPEGATPKDGPSAGITMATTIASILTNSKVRADVAMTGELTLSNRVLPIGGLKEKLIAAYKAKIKKALIPVRNYENDLKDIPKEVKESMEIVAVATIDDVLKHALV